MRAPALLALLLLLPVGALGAGEPRERVVVQLAAPPTVEQRAQLIAHGAFAFSEVIDAVVAEVAAADLAWLGRQPWVTRIEPDLPLRRTLDLSTRLIRAGSPLLDLGFDGSGVTVAVLDSGIDTMHPDFGGRVLANVVYANGAWVPTPGDLDGHGTHVAGIVAGDGSASGGALRGVAPGAGLVGMDFSRSFTTSTALQAFDWVLQHGKDYNIRVVENSWGRAESPNVWDAGDSLVRASSRMVREGFVVVFSAGNHGPKPGTISLEGQNPDVITVGAVDDAGLLPSFSGRGPAFDAQGRETGWVKPDVVADGVGILSTRASQAAGAPQPPDLVPSQLPQVPGLRQGLAQEALRYHELSGTSQAAPHVAGIIAVMLQADPSLTPAQVHDIVRESAIDLGPEGPDPGTGFGLVDARDAVRRALGRAQDRGNVLLAGGEERYDQRGSLTGAAGQLVQTSPFVQVKEQGAIEASFPVKVGATSVRFDFAWSPAVEGFRVYLVGNTGTQGPWTSARTEGGERVVSGRVDDPVPGVYKLVARPAAPLQVSYHASEVVTVREHARLPAQLEQRYRAPGEQSPLEQVGSEFQYELDKVSQGMRRLVPGPDLALLAVALMGAALVARRRA